MARLPTPGSDDGVWGNVLNDFLGVEHNADGTLRTSASLASKTDKSILTVKGDMYVATAASMPARLGVGSSRQRLMADSTTNTGLTWADAVLASVKDYNVDTVGLAAAITAAVTAGANHVFIPAGTYTENTTYVVPSGIKISGEGYGTNIVRTTSGNIFEITGTSGVHKAHVAITDLRMSGPSTQASSVAGSGIYFDYADDCRITGCWATGFGLTNSNDGGISGIRSQRIQITGNACLLNANGIIVGQPTGEVGLTDSILTDNRCYSNWEDGIHSQQGTYNTITSNVCDSNGAVNSGSGIDLFRETGTCMAANICRLNGGNGIEVGSPNGADSDIAITGNICHSNASNGISVANKSIHCVIAENVCFSNTSHGVSVSTSGTASATMELIVVSANRCRANGSSGINFSNTASGSVLQYCSVVDNICSTNTSHGILLTGNVTNIRVADNVCRSNTSNGIRLSSQSSNVPDSNIVENNTVAGNGTQIGESGDTNTILRANKGFNPQGIAAISVGASPYTYTAGFTPEVIYISGGTVSAVVKSATTLFAQSNVTVRLEPSESVAITYSSAPTMIKDRQ